MKKFSQIGLLINKVLNTIFIVVAVVCALAAGYYYYLASIGK